MPRLPDKTLIQSRTDFFTPQVHAPDASGLVSGINQLGTALRAEGEKMANADKGLDLIKADAALDTSLREATRTFRDDPDFGTYETRFGATANQAVQDAASGIRDPKLREKWLLQRGQHRANAALDHVMGWGHQRAVQAKEVEVGNILQGHQSAYLETDDQDERARILTDMDAALKVGEGTGLILPRTAQRLRQHYIDGALQVDADARINAGDAEGVLRDMGLMPGGRQSAPPVKLVAPKSDIGSVSAKYESGGQGVGFVSTGAGDPGGPSYGIHQLSSKDSMPAFLRSEEGAPYAAKLRGLAPGSAEFNRVYKQVTADDPDGMAAAQKAFYTRTHYAPLLEKAKELGYAVDDRGVQEALFSMAVQHGGAARIVESAASSTARDPREQIKALYAARTDYVAGLGSLPGRTKQSVLNRYRSEVKDALRLSGTTTKDDARDMPRGVDPETGEPSDPSTPVSDEGMGLIPWGEATQIDVTNPRIGQYRMLTGARRQAIIHKAKTALSAKTQQDIQADIARIEDGQDEARDERGESAFDRAARILTPNQLEKFSQARQMAVLKRDSIRSLQYMPEDEVPDHLARIGEGMPDNAYGQVRKVREQADAAWKKIQEVRRKDPAAAVARHPVMMDALRQMQNAGSVGLGLNEDGDPVMDFQKMTPDQAQLAARQVAQATLRAQSELGIPEALQRTISKRQAQKLLNMPDPATLSERDLRTGLENAARRASAVYGPELGQRVFTDALALAYRAQRDTMKDYRRWGGRAIEDDQRAQDERFKLVAKQAFGQPITREDLQRVQQLQEIDNLPPIMPDTSGFNPGQPYIGQRYLPTQQGTRQPTAQHVDLLLQQIAKNPKQAANYRAIFDSRFGDGAAARAMSQIMGGQ